jgi:tetratricopeptide (TPR) repeat protein
MKNEKLFHIINLFLCLSAITAINAQQQNENYTKYIKQGDKQFNKGNYHEAENSYRFIYDSVSSDTEVQSRLGVVLTLTKKYREAINLLKPIVDTSQTIDYYMTYQLAHAFHQLYAFEDALKYYSNCLSDTSDIGSNSKLGIKQCRLAMEMDTKRPDDVWVYQLDTGINTVFNELAPKLMYDSVLLFNSLRVDQNSILNIFSATTNSLYYSIISHAGYSNAQKLHEIRKSTLAETISNYQLIGRYPATNDLFIYSDTVNKKLVLSDYLVNNTVSVLNTNLVFGSMGPTLAVFLDNGQKAYFIKANNDSGIWNNDIYSTQKDSAGQWTNITKLPPPFNSEANEEALFWDDTEKKLYFSSNRDETIGGYDIFVCETDDSGQLLPPRNMGFPINTPANDLFFFKEGLRAWYTSDIGINKHDIYEVRFKEKPEFLEKPTPVNQPDLPWHQKHQDIDGVIHISDYVYLQNLYFNNDQTYIDTLDEAYQTLLHTLLDNESVTLKFTAYTDWYGNKELNEKISFLRVSNLYYQLYKKGVAANQIQLEFKGGKEYRTILEFDDYKDKRTARRANRCITIEPVKQTSPYLIINENDEFKKFTKQVAPLNYAVMLYISSSDTEDIGIENIKKTFLRKNGVYIYHTPFVHTIEKAKQELEKLSATHKDVYIFELQP